MPAIKETTVHDMKTHFSHYAEELLNGTYNEIVVKNRTKPTLRILPYTPPEQTGIKFGVAKELGLPAADMDVFDALDSEIAEMFKDYM